MGYEKGHPGGPGRPKGSHNKASAAFVADLVAAYQNEGGVKYLQKLARSNKNAFAALLGKLVPKDLHVSADVRLAFTEWLAALAAGGADSTE